MKATIVSVFKSKKYMMHYWYHNTKKFNDDHESILYCPRFVVFDK